MVKINFYFANIQVSLLKLTYYTQTGFPSQYQNQVKWIKSKTSISAFPNKNICMTHILAVTTITALS